MIAGPGDGTDDAHSHLAGPIGALIPGEEVSGESKAQGRGQQQYAGHPRQLSRPFVGPPDKNLPKVEQEKNHHGAGSPVMDAADKPAEWRLVLNVFHALPRRRNRWGVTGDQQDAGDDLKDEVEQEQASKRGRPT